MISGAAQGIDLAYGAEGEKEIGNEDGLNHDFCDEWTKQMKNLYKLHMDGIKHACECELVQNCATHSYPIPRLRSIWAI